MLHLAPIEIGMTPTTEHRVAPAIFLNVDPTARTLLAQFLDRLLGCPGGFGVGVTAIVSISLVVSHDTTITRHDSRSRKGSWNQI